MTDTQIVSALTERPVLPTVYTVITEFKIGYQRAFRCLEEARKRKPLTLEDF